MKKSFGFFWCMVCLAVYVSGCQKMEPPVKGEINQEAVTVEFPEYYEKAYDKLNFKTVIVVPEKADVNGLERFTAKRAGYDMNSAYDAFFKDREVKEIHEGDVLGDNGKMLKSKHYVGTNKEYFHINGESLTFSLPFSNYILRCVYPESGRSRYNLDRYELNGELKFMSGEDVYEEILSVLNRIGFESDMDFIPSIYAMDYKILEQEEYASDMYGNEDTSKYKESWNDQDSCYYCFVRQKIEGLPLYYVYGNVMKNVEACYTGVEVIYSEEGIQRLDIDKLFEMNPSEEKKPVSLLTLDELTEKVESQYEMIISDDVFEVNKMALYMMAQKNTENSYDIFPVWILFMDQIQMDGGEEIRTLWGTLEIPENTAFLQILFDYK
ncbi:hypothetical protein NSA48_00035 [Frisingicoccus caecimuris]|uniref:Uncharacterized protein n=1 Tax=Frisingicoccus caecimuris TaxID=1796636 RepID=A0A4R2LP66_9FIRM|nr:hypothetical protein [Frisingicoccus caecimuris]MCR1917428.1 hypothetical protein [Frisingicoccus caecimuris]TCO85694.1 hypothetical protein EV212_1028 [Frisingicoccus caecimuris]